MTTSRLARLDKYHALIDEWPLWTHKVGRPILAQGSLGLGSIQVCRSAVDHRKPIGNGDPVVVYFYATKAVPECCSTGQPTDR